MKNAYAKRLVREKAALSEAERQRLINQVAGFCLNLFTVVLNDEFGFGGERIARFAAAFDQGFVEYGHLLDTDAEYADGVLQRRVKQILGTKGGDVD